jgi:hypothetical protein
MPKRYDGNEQDIRVRPDLDAHSLEGDNPFTGAHPPGKDVCDTGYGDQIDIEVTPPGGGSQINTYDFSYIVGACEHGMNNKSMNTLIIRILKSHFSRASNIFDPFLKTTIYDSNPSLSKIRIVMNTNWSPDADASKLPAIVLKRAAQRVSRIVIGDTGELYKKLQGIYDYTRVNTGTHQLLCIAQGDGYMESLAEEVFYVLTCLSPYIRTWFPIYNFEPQGMGEIGFFDTVGRTLAIPIELSYAYEYSWTLQHVTPDLRNIQVTPAIDLETTGTDNVRLCPDLT